MTKYIFVTGGVISGIGKGITTASLGRLLINRGFKVIVVKIDPYLNVDAGVMNPFQHGEVFVTRDGAETDLDLGNYERFLGIDLNKYSNFTTGSVYKEVIEKERRGDYLGETVQLIPHITDEIKRRIYQIGEDNEAEIVITEIGGTIGDFEMPPFVEAIRQIAVEVGRENAMFLHVSLIYTLPKGESKSKPTQHSIRKLQELGVQPDVLLCRTSQTLEEAFRRKIALLCGISEECIFEGLDTKCVDEIPLNFERQGMGHLVSKKLGLEARAPMDAEWGAMVEKLKNPRRHVRIAIVGKYTTGNDAYISVQEALKHGGIANETSVEIEWIEAESLMEHPNLDGVFENADGILVPGGFGYRGIEGMLVAAGYARENNIPYFGLCLGMQCLVIEFARHVAKLKKANSTEVDEKTPYPVIDLMPEQRSIADLGATMRLGHYPCVLKENTKSYDAYQQPIILERHRHRYELNNQYRSQLEAAGLCFSGLSPDESLVEIAEVTGHPWMVGSQFHPEFQSKPLAPHPLFREFIAAVLSYQSKAENMEGEEE
ncbi:CTP synthase [Candidatus Poribacteria bacterium]|nr:CTP synthase [Candidatus Poribacteria bacterium]MYH81985.1 CTP synthase [Candidatus Poribacteria bacterium]MYK97009.1 CTP synthase [Candidatus Poribacteria bacterium]